MSYILKRNWKQMENEHGKLIPNGLMKTSEKLTEIKRAVAACNVKRWQVHIKQIEITWK